MTTRIIGIGACVPDTIVTNNDLTAFLDVYKRQGRGGPEWSGSGSGSER